MYLDQFHGVCVARGFHFFLSFRFMCSLGAHPIRSQATVYTTFLNLIIFTFPNSSHYSSTALSLISVGEDNHLYVLINSEGVSIPSSREKSQTLTPNFFQSITTAYF